MTSPISHGEQTVGESGGVLERHRLSRRARARELRRAGRLHADDARVRQPQLDRRRDAGAESAAADRDEHGVDVRQVGGDLETDRALPRDDQGMVVRRNKRQPFLSHQLFGALQAIGRGRPASTTRAPSRSAPPRLAAVTVVGMTTVAGTPNSFAASATACA